MIDQTPEHDQQTERELHALQRDGRIRWVRLLQPSIPSAMNQALRSTERALVLFLDDDIIPACGLVRQHVETHNQYDPWVVVGQIIQPWQKAGDLTPPPASQHLTADFDFPFHTTQSCWLQNAMAGNMSVRRVQTSRIGGFDENFKGVAYRFETEFARRVIRNSGRIRFCPSASIQHLRVERGGTRIHGNHLNSADPKHGVGEYYFAMREGWTSESLFYMLRRMVREVSTRYHLRRPWYVPVKLIGEIRAFCWAFRLQWRGPAFLSAVSERQEHLATPSCDASLTAELK